MRYLRNAHLQLVMLLGLACGSVDAWGQGGSSRGGSTGGEQGAAQQPGGRGRGAARSAEQGAAPQSAATQATQATQPGTTGRGARGGAEGAAAVDLYTYDATLAAGAVIPDVPPVETQQQLAVDGTALAYVARAGHLPLRNPTTGQSEAFLFYTYYAREGLPEGTVRPLIFFLGGAPGVAAAWQDFGGLGPKRMKWASDGTAGSPPYSWMDNPHTLLGQADLVFVNPVGTGFSRPVQPARGPGFWNTAGDIASLAEFVRSFLTTYERRNAPLFIAGEDLGTARAAGLANYLMDHQIPVTGLVLFSMALSADAIAGDAQFITLLPSQILASWAHKKLAPDLQALSAGQIAEQARQFAAREYLHALYKGERMTAAERSQVAANLSRLTGLAKAFIVNNNLRIPLDRFSGELLRESRRALSYSDARVTGYVPVAAGGGGRGGFGAAPAAAIDYNLSLLAGGFLSAYDTYLRRELTFAGNGLFYLMNGGVGSFTSTGSSEASLSAAFARNPRLCLYVGANYFDLTAPFYATEHTLAHLNVSPEVRANNIVVGHFEAGQMVYVDSRSLAKMHLELTRFLQKALSLAGR